MLSTTLVITFIVLCAAVPAGMALYRRRLRLGQLRDLAEQWNMDFLPKGDAATSHDLAGFHIATQGCTPMIRNLLKGQSDDLDVALFDFKYQVGSEESLEVHWQTMALFLVDGLNLTAFALRPKMLRHRFAKIFGYRAIEFGDRSRFDEIYLLRGPDEEAVRQLFRGEIRDYLSLHAGLSIEGQGKRFLFYRLHERVEVHDMKELLADALEALDFFR